LSAYALADSKMLELCFSFSPVHQLYANLFISLTVLCAAVEPSKELIYAVFEYSFHVSNPSGSFFFSSFSFSSSCSHIEERE